LPSGDTVAGHVLDASGGPVPGARVTARATDGDSQVLAVAESDATGAFRLEVRARTVDLSAQVEAYSLATRWVEVPALDANLVLAPAARLCGRVVARGTGRAVASTTVHAQNNNALRAEPKPVQSDAQGAFCFEALSAGMYALWVAGNGFRSERAWQVLGVGQSVDDMRLEALPAGSLDGLIRTRGAPCAEGSVELVGASQLRFFSRSHDGRVLLEGLPPALYTARIYCDAAQPLIEPLELGTARATRTWDLDGGLELRGRVQGPNGGPRAGVGVLITPSGDLAALDVAPPLRAVSDDRGEFLAQGLMGGDYALSIEGPAQRAEEPTVVSVSEHTAPVELVTVAEASIHAELRGSRTAFAQREDLNFPVQAERRGDQFVFEHLALGRYALFTSDRGVVPSDALRVELRADGEVVKVTLEAHEELSAISGRVEDEAGQPVLDAWVTASAAQPTPFVRDVGEDPVLTNERGEFMLRGLRPGRYRLEVASDQGEAAAPDVATGSEVVMRVPR
jgi:hypothetical protein